MKIIRHEELRNRSIYYLDELTPDGQVVERRRYDCKTFPIDYGSHMYVFIGDQNDRIRPLPNYYVNTVRSNAAPESRVSMARAIQRYYIYCDMFGHDPAHFPKRGYEGFKRFLKGEEIESIHGSEPHYASVKTVRATISMVRKFLSFFDYSISSFEVGREKERHVVMRGNKARSSYYSKGDPDLRGNPRDAFKPVEHFNPYQATRMADSMAAKGDRQMLILFLLGYQTGLRRGEMLGLTRKDIISRYEPLIDTETGEERHEIVYRIIIRNRPGEDRFHRSKTLRRPVSSKQMEVDNDFKDSYYNPEITEDLYHRLLEYYQWSRDVNRLGAETVRKITKATEVPGEPGNHYLFYNIYLGVCRLLNGNTFNNRLRVYLEEEGLHLRNVSHSLRHSFAMFLAHYSDNKVDIKIVQVQMRHRSPLSTLIYFNLPEEDKHALVNLYGSEIAGHIKYYKTAA